MEKFYTSERNTQMLIYLMKKHGVKKIVVSPGTTNVCLVGSLQQDSYFELYSSVDERSAAYIACGLASESGEPVALSCTGATASRNYVSGLTEAYYRKLPVLAITSTQYSGRVGHYIPQVIDRSNVMNDIANYSVEIPVIRNEEEEWFCNIELNKALLELRHNGGGPVHINLTTTYSKDYSVKELPEFRTIRRYQYGDMLPEITGKRVGIFVGAHQKWDEKLTKVVDKFCEKYNGVVLCDPTSNYTGQYKVDFSLICSQTMYKAPCRNMDILIHIGYVSGAYTGFNSKTVWRVNPDGEIRDTFGTLEKVFQMEEIDFFKEYTDLFDAKDLHIEYYDEWIKEIKKFANKEYELPFSNAWIAKQTSHRLPTGANVYFGILNTLRTWSYFDFSKELTGYSNTGGFGIDGGLSTLLGISLASPNKLMIGILGDLGFFYDMNAAGNRHVSNNIRLMVVNNGRGTEFRNYNHPAARFGEEADKYMAAAGHYGKKSSELLKHYAQDLGFEYISASSKEEYLTNVSRFVSPKMNEKPIVFEVFTDSSDESDALKIMHTLEAEVSGKTKQMVKEILGESGVKTVKKILGRN